MLENWSFSDHISENLRQLRLALNYADEDDLEPLILLLPPLKY